MTEKAKATHSSTLAWKIPWTEELGRLQSMWSLSWAQLSDFTFTFHFHALEKTLESPLDCKEVQPAQLKEISPVCSLEGLMLKVKLQNFDHLM